MDRAKKPKSEYTHYLIQDDLSVSKHTFFDTKKREDPFGTSANTSNKLHTKPRQAVLLRRQSSNSSSSLASARFKLL